MKVPNFFERFGVSGCSLVVTGRGPTPVQHVGYEDLMVSRSVRYAEPVGILKSHAHTGTADAPESVMVNSGLFKDVIPQGDVIVGSRVELRLHPPNGVSRGLARCLSIWAPVGALRRKGRAARPSLKKRPLFKFKGSTLCSSDLMILPPTLVTLRDHVH